jgi:hypothetical protein
MAGTMAGTKEDTPNILANAARPKVTPKRASPGAKKAGTKGEGASCVAYFQIPNPYSYQLTFSHPIFDGRLIASCNSAKTKIYK